MQTESCKNMLGPEVLWQLLTANQAVMVAGAPAAIDVDATSGAAAARGGTIGAHSAVAACVMNIENDNGFFFAGVAEKAMAIGDQKRIVSWGPTTAKVRNAEASSRLLPVGTLLYLSTAGAYFVPSLQGTGSVNLAAVVANAHPLPRAYVRVATTITAATTADVPVYIFPPTPPRVERHSLYSQAAFANSTTYCLGLTKGFGRVLRVGLGWALNGTTGRTLSALCTVGGRTILGTAVTIASDGAEPLHTFKSKAIADLGTGGNFGVLTATASDLICSPDEFILIAMTNGSSCDATGCMVDVDILYF